MRRFPCSSMSLGSPGEVRRGPDGELYEWTEAVDGLGNVHGFWSKLKRIGKKALRVARPLAMKYATSFVPGGQFVREGLRFLHPPPRQRRARPARRRPRRRYDHRRYPPVHRSSLQGLGNPYPEPETLSLAEVKGSWDLGHVQDYVDGLGALEATDSADSSWHEPFVDSIEEFAHPSQPPELAGDLHVVEGLGVEDEFEDDWQAAADFDQEQVHGAHLAEDDLGEPTVDPENLAAYEEALIEGYVEDDATDSLSGFVRTAEPRFEPRFRDREPAMWRAPW